jgi:starvation-inducible outer membrane lipoprotein
LDLKTKKAPVATGAFLLSACHLMPNGRHKKRRCRTPPFSN